MALYIDSAYLDDITAVMLSVPVAGVTTNPTILLAAQERGQDLAPQTLLRELLQRSPAGVIFMQPGAVEESAMLQEALKYIEADPRRVIPKIPMNLAGMRVALRLKAMKYRIAFTAVTSEMQAYAAAMAQADYIIPYYNRLERTGTDASERIAHIAGLLHNEQKPTRILAASIKSPQEATSALLAGAHDLTAAPQVLLDMLSDPQSEQAIVKFEQDWQKMKIL